jgi:hypothetical protein
MMKGHIGGSILLGGFAIAVGALVLGVAPSFAAKTSTTGGLAAKTLTGLTLYSVATGEQFVDNADDRARGKGNNPFGNYHDSTATTKEAGNGPFPGDEALFKFSVYQSGNLKKNVGSAVFTCQYNFNKHAFCDVNYQLSGGTLVGSGGLDFNASDFVIPIFGGTGKYLGVHGELQSTPGPQHSEHLVFKFID